MQNILGLHPPLSSEEDRIGTFYDMSLSVQRIQTWDRSTGKSTPKHTAGQFLHIRNLTINCP